MGILNITEKENPNKQKQRPIREKQNIYIPDIIDQNISRRNGMVSLFCGSGGSGKSSLLLNMFKDKNQYKGRFNNIWYFCPLVSFLSVKKHPFEFHDKVYHELTTDALEEIFNKLVELKQQQKDEEDDDDTEEEKREKIQYNTI